MPRRRVLVGIGGRVDLAAFVDYGAGQTVLEFWAVKTDLSGFTAPAVVWSSTTYSWTWSGVKAAAGDFNGDGKVDIQAIDACCGIYQNSAWLFTSTGTGVVSGAPTLLWQGALGPVGTGSVAPTASVKYQLVNVASGKCAEVPGGSTVDGTRLDQSTCVSGALHQQFTLREVGAGVFTMAPSQVSDRCADVADYSTADGARIQQWPCNAQYEQNFTLTYLYGWGSNVVVNVVALFSGKCVDVTGSSTANGALLQQWPCNGGTQQQFTVRPAT
jgi:hypothetical protein